MRPAYRLFRITRPFRLESGLVLPGVEVAYHTYGRLNRLGDNVVWICHALTANSDAGIWWEGMIGRGRLFDPSRYFIVCANMLGSCYGSSGPLSLNPLSGDCYYGDFPEVTVRDTVNAMIELRKALGIAAIKVCAGGSMGGQQALEWAVSEPGRIGSLFPIAANARHSPWGIALNTSQRMAIESDPTWRGRSPSAGREGLRAARAIGMLSYRNYNIFSRTQADGENTFDEFRASTYLRHQGDKLAGRFNALSYWLLTRAMDRHNVGRGRGGIEAALRQIRARTLAVGISSDILFPLIEQEQLADCIPHAAFAKIESVYGHDGFLIESAQLSRIIGKFLDHPNAVRFDLSRPVTRKTKANESIRQR